MLVFAIFGDFYKERHFAASMHINSCNPWRFLEHLNGITRYLPGHESCLIKILAK